MKCVGYDLKFEKHLAHSLKSIKPPSSSGSAKKRKVVLRIDDGSSNKDEEEDNKEEPKLDDSPSKRQRIAKGKAKLVKYDWKDAKFHDSEDEDYKPV